jgi:hypothetical protein
MKKECPPACRKIPMLVLKAKRVNRLLPGGHRRREESGPIIRKITRTFRSQEAPSSSQIQSTELSWLVLE